MKRISTIVTFFMMLSLVLPTFAFAVAPKPSTVSLTVVLKNQSLSDSFKTFVIKSGGTIEKEIPALGAVVVKGNADLITTLQKNTEVQSVGPAIKMQLPAEKKVAYQPDAIPAVTQDLIPPGGGGGDVYPDLYYELQWDIKRVTNYGASFTNNSGSHKVVIGIIDTGVDSNHPDLSKNYIVGGKNYVPKNWNGDTTETGDPTDIMDRNGHGSYVAGAIAGKGHILGVAPGIGYKSYRVFGAEGGADTSTVAQAIMGAANDGVDVISMSIGGYSVIGQTFWTDPSTGKRYSLGNEVADFLLYKRAVKYAIDRGITVVAAAGNDNLNITTKAKVTDFLNKELGGDGYSFVGAGFEQPGLVPGVITVSATGPLDTKASYSNYGPGSIDVTAPGGDAQRYDKGQWYLDLNFGAYKGGDYIFMGGTSMATPKVSAVAGLLINKYGKVGPQKIAQMIRDSAEDIGDQGKDQYFGSGMVQAPYEKEQLPKELDWQKSFGGQMWEGDTKAHQTSDGGYISVGFSQTFSSKGRYFDTVLDSFMTDRDLLVVKTGKDGRTEWYRTLGSDFLNEGGNDILQTKDGGYLVLGFTDKYEHDQFKDIYLVKLSAAGEIQWEKTYGKQQVSDQGTNLLQTSDGGYVIAGSRGGSGLLLKIDSNGIKQWEKTYGGEPSTISFKSIKATSDKGYIIAGQYFTADGSDHGLDYYLLKTDGNGNVQWEKKYGNGNLANDALNDVVETPDGQFIVVGNSGIMEWLSDYPQKKTKRYFANFSKSGALKWEKYGEEPNTNSSAEALTKTPNGNYLAVGWKHQNLNTDVTIWKFDQNGNPLLEKQYGGNRPDTGFSIEATKDGGYIIGGVTSTYTAGNGADDGDMYLLKLNSSIN